MAPADWETIWLIQLFRLEVPILPLIQSENGEMTILPLISEARGV